MKILVTGGAGYIGSHTCVELLKAGHEVFVIDNLSNGHESALERVRLITNCELQFMNADIRDSNALDKIFNTFKPDSVIHFAGLKAVGESVVDPVKYYDVNVGGSISLLSAMSKAECNIIVFSSSATVYGEPQYLPYDEEHPTNPVNPYGRTKLMIENIIQDWTKVDIKRRGTILRYFNPVGAHESGQIGEEPIGVPNNLMPYIAQVADGRREHLNIFGNDYDTLDGTGARDYIHVVDLALAHTIALSQNKLNKFEILNIGRGKSTTVLELIKSFEETSGVTIKLKYSPRRDGDLAAFWANSSKSFEKMSWKPKRNIKNICEDTWRWHKLNPTGYGRE
ncbi:UDP-glucose 4-epimerase GalE [Amylibacter sp.]|nr:UDP-glucose 4-epimerase GalE [Amylibacter sp.]MDC1041473.1 UDP-glucose 4-epimerase GalE [Amylibacter sp.]